MMVMMVVVVQLLVLTMVVAMSPKVMETASDPPKCVRHGGKQVQENAEQGIVCFQVQVLHPNITFLLCQMKLQYILDSLE